MAWLQIFFGIFMDDLLLQILRTFNIQTGLSASVAFGGVCVMGEMRFVIPRMTWLQLVFGIFIDNSLLIKLRTFNIHTVWVTYIGVGLTSIFSCLDGEKGRIMNILQILYYTNLDWKTLKLILFELIFEVALYRERQQDPLLKMLNTFNRPTWFSMWVTLGSKPMEVSRSSTSMLKCYFQLFRVV